MDYQKLLTEEQIYNIYVAEGDIVSFYNLEGKLCTKNHKGEISIIENKEGTEGKDGITPHIGDNGNWFIGEEDTGFPSRGEKGDKGENGEQGIQGENGENGENGKDGVDGITPHIGDNGNWFIGDEDTGVKASGSSENLESIKIQIDEILNNKIEISSSCFPVAIQTQKGNIYPIEKNTLSFENNKWSIDVRTYLVYDNVNIFTASWYVYCAGGYNPPIIKQFNETGSLTHTMHEGEYLYHKKDCSINELTLNINKDSNNSCICFNTGSEFTYTINISDNSNFYLGGGTPNFIENKSYIVAVDNMTIIWSSLDKYE